MNELFSKNILSYNILSVDDVKLAEQYLQPFSVPRNYMLEAADKVPRYLYYILSGYVRIFHYADNGDEITSHINCPSGFMTAFRHFVDRTESPFYVESITPCELVGISRDHLDILLETSPAWKDLSLYILQESTKYNESRALDFSSLTAEQRYRKLLATQPEIIQSVPLQYIASFLGIKPESLSRIRRNMIS